jgi:hypothetical protein
MDDNGMNLSELKKQGIKLTDDNLVSEKTIGSSWADAVTQAVPTEAPVVPEAIKYQEPTPVSEPMVADDNIKMPVQEQPQAVYNPEARRGPVLPSENEPEPMPQYDGPGMVVENEAIREATAVKEIQAVGLPIDFDSNISKYMEDYDKRIEEAKSKKEEAEPTQAEQNFSDTETENKEVDDDSLDYDAFNKKFDEAIVIIDKTNMGRIIDFTEDERKKLERAKVIKLEEIQDIALKTIRTKKITSGKNNFSIDEVLRRKQSLHASNVVLPASQYTAVLKGCTPYELMELVTENPSQLIVQEAKWGLIYSKIESTSIGKMTYNQFLQNTATADYPVLVYGILCATYPDDDKFPLTCQKEGCKHLFEHYYSVKSLIRAEKMSEELKIKFAAIVDHSHTSDDAKAFHDTCPVISLKRIQLPMSGYVLDISMQSAYDFMYKSIKELQDNKEEKYNQAAITSSIVRSIFIPDGDEYLQFDNPIDITKAIYHLNSTDLKILYKTAQELFDHTAFEFGLMNVVCPNCRTKTNTVPVDVESILFYKYQQELSTTIG